MFRGLTSAVKAKKTMRHGMIWEDQSALPDIAI